MSAAELCSYCGLPLSSGWRLWRRRAETGDSRGSREANTSRGSVFCCSGCRFAAEVTAESQAGSPINKPLARLGIAVFLTVNVLMFTMVLWSSDVYSVPQPAVAAVKNYESRGSNSDAVVAAKQDSSKAGDSQNILGSKLDNVFRWLILVLTIPVLWLLGEPLAANAWQEIRRTVAAVDLLLLLGVVAAFLYSLVSVVRGHGHVYFEVACVVLVLVTLGRWFESIGKLRAVESMDSLAKLLPLFASRISYDGEQEVAVADLHYGDRIHVRPGERIAADGKIVAGTASIDEQLITGESRPHFKQTGDAVFGGTLNLDGQLQVRVAADGGYGTVQRMVEAMQQARTAKGHYQKLADRLAAWFLPLTLALSLGTLVWHTRQAGIESGLLASLSVLLIACPCALGLATPMSVWVALGIAAKNQVLFRHGDAIERMAAVKSMFFDKTGTLSSGQCGVLRCELGAGESYDDVLDHAARLAVGSQHPLSKAICRFADGSTQTFFDEVLSFENLPGRGLTGVSGLTNEATALGNRRLMEELNLTIPPEIESAARCSSASSCVFVGWDSKVRGAFIINEQLRPEAIGAIRQLRQLNIELEVLSGDDASRTVEFSRWLGIPVRGGLLPEEKLNVVQATSSKSRGAVCMVGDGINDAPALAASDVGIALSCGADVSREAADVCLMGNDLSRLPWAICLARRTVRTIKQNLFWAFAYNLVGMGLAMSGKLNPIWASAAMMLSSFFVIGNSLRLGVTIESNVSEGQPAGHMEETFAPVETEPSISVGG